MAKLLIVKLLLLGLLLLSSASQKHALKDVLFIAVDDLRTQLSCYGENAAKTPHIDTLAAQSMVFERAYCQVAVCSPSRTSLLTGRRPDTNHVWRIADDQYWRTFTNATTIPQYFKENGYISIGMGKIFHPGRPNGFDDKNYSWSLPYFHGNNKVSSHDCWHSFENISESDLRDGQTADKAVETIKQIKQNRTKGDNKPFFLAAGFHKPHLPFFAPSKYYDMYPAAKEIALPKNPAAPVGIPPIAWSSSFEIRGYSNMKAYNSPQCKDDAQASMYGKECHFSDTDSRILRKAYYAALSYTDAQIGRVLAELKTQGLDNNTIIVFWADHGWKLGEHNMWGKFTNLEDDTHVPFTIRVPGVTDSGMRTAALVELIDIFPSLTELAGLPVPPLCAPDIKDVLACVEGSSVAPLFKDPKQQWKKAAFSQYPRPQAGLSTIPNMPAFKDSNDLEDVMGYAVRVDTYRFVEWYSFDHVNGKPKFDTVWGTELYDHSTPVAFFNDENTNLAKQANMTDKVKELRAMLKAGWRAALPPGN